MQNRRLSCVLLLAVAGLLGSCGGRTGNPTAASAPSLVTLYAPLYATGSETAPSFAGTVRIANRESIAARVGISIEGHLFRDRGEMLAYIAALPPMYEGEPDYRKAWRFLTARAYFYTPYTGHDEQHDPLRFVNSLGYGYCDDFASVLASIWQWQGYESRVWWMTGHVVPEIRIEDRWMMFDADLGVYYENRSGEVASVGELAADPQLIVDPIDRLYAPGYVAYDPLVADIYASMADNQLQVPLAGEIRGMQIDLPAGSELLFPVEDAGDRTLFWDSTLSHPLYYGVQLSIPRVAHDTTLRLPLFVNGISGTGTVEIGGQSYEIGSSGLDARFGPFWVPDNYTEPVTTVTLRAGANNVVIRMSLSAFVVDGTLTARVRVSPQAGAPVEVTTTKSWATQAPEAEIVSRAAQQLEIAPSGHASPQLVFSDLGSRLSQQR